MTPRETFLAWFTVVDTAFLSLCLIMNVLAHKYTSSTVDILGIGMCIYIIRAINRMVDKRDTIFRNWQKTWNHSVKG
jgi:hypothetical protein